MQQILFSLELEGKMKQLSNPLKLQDLSAGQDFHILHTSLYIHIHTSLTLHTHTIYCIFIISFWITHFNLNSWIINWDLNSNSKYNIGKKSLAIFIPRVNLCSDFHLRFENLATILSKSWKKYYRQQPNLC